MEPRGIAGLFLKSQEFTVRTAGKIVPLPPERILQNLSRYDAIWMAQLIPEKGGIDSWNLLRKSKPSPQLYYYVSSCTSRPIQSSLKLVYLDYDYINRYHPEWFLLSDSQTPSKSDPRVPDNRIRWHLAKKGDPYYNRFHIDVGNKEFQLWAAEQFLISVSGRRQNLPQGYDGLSMDNVYVGGRVHKRISHSHPRWKYAGKPRLWDNVFCEYLKVVKSVLNQHGYVVIANNNPDRDRTSERESWEMLYESVDGLVTEQELRYGWSKTPYFFGNEWLEAITQHEEVLDRGLIYWWVCSPFDKNSFLYTYCSWLLIKVPGKSYYFSPRGGGTEIPWYDEYDLLIGKPISKRYMLDNCWVRDYSNAKVVVNPSKNVQKVVVDERKLWLDWETKRAGSELLLPPQTGRILLPTAYDIGEVVE